MQGSTALPFTAEDTGEMEEVFEEVLDRLIPSEAEDGEEPEIIEEAVIAAGYLEVFRKEKTEDSPFATLLFSLTKGSRG